MTEQQPTAVKRDRIWDIARLVLNAVVFLLATWAFVRGFSFRPLAAYFPVTAAGMIALFTAIQMGLDVYNYVKGRPVVIAGMDVESPIHGMGLAGFLLALRYIGWFVGYFIAMWVTGVFVSSVVFVAAFLRVEAKWEWRGITIVAVAVVIGVWLMLGGLELGVPRTILDIGHGFL